MLPMSVLRERAPKNRRFAPGFNLVELAMVILTVSLLTAFALISFGSSGEQRDARMVQAAQANLQSIVSQGAVRMDLPPAQLAANHANAILTAIRSSVGQLQNGSSSAVSFTNSGSSQFAMQITSSNRGAVFQITNTGDVSLIQLSNFSSYVVDSSNGIGTIRKTP